MSVWIDATPEQLEACRNKLKDMAGREPASLSLPEYMTLIALARCAVDMTEAAGRADAILSRYT